MVNKSLVALVDETSALERALIESGGEITEEIAKLLEVRDLHLPTKVDNYALVIDRMESISTFYKMKADAYLLMAKAASGVIDRCQFNLKLAMQAMHTDELTGFDVRYRLTNSTPACIIEDETMLDAGYKITETITKIDKKRLVEDLKLGVPVDGARLEKTTALRRYMNSPSKKVVANE